MLDKTALLRAYDEQLRTEAEMVGTVSVTRLGPLWIGIFEGGRGFVTYRDLGEADAADVAGLVAEAFAHFHDNPRVGSAEWKTRGHDRAPGLHEALLASGFVPEEPESIMVGEARALVQEVSLPQGVTLRRVTEEADVRAMCAMQAVVFDDSPSEAAAMVEAMLRMVADGDDTELWVAETGGEIVSAGRVGPVAGTDFAGIWGGATLPEWRGRGIYRALTAARARSALAAGKSLINSDSTEFSRPILERSGLVKVGTTTPYVWRR